MSEKKFSTYPGQWPCKVCGEVVTSLRLWPETADLTWVCTKKHMSKVNLLPPTRKDYERKERE